MARKHARWRAKGTVDGVNQSLGIAGISDSGCGEDINISIWGFLGQCATKIANGTNCMGKICWFHLAFGGQTFTQKAWFAHVEDFPPIRPFRLQIRAKPSEKD